MLPGTILFFFPFHFTSWRSISYELWKWIIRMDILLKTAGNYKRLLGRSRQMLHFIPKIFAVLCNKWLTWRRDDLSWINKHILTEKTVFVFSRTGEAIIIHFQFSSVQFSYSVMSDCMRPHDRSTPGLSVHHQLPESTQTQVHPVGDAIQPSHPLLSPSPPARNLSQHQGLFQWVSSSHEVAKVLEFQLQHQSFQWTPRTDLL